MSQHSSEPEQRVGPVTAQAAPVKMLFDPMIQHLEEGGTAVAAVQLLFRNLESHVRALWVPL